MSENDQPPTPNLRHQKQQLAAIVNYVAQLLVASSLTVWGVVNLIINARMLFFSPATESLETDPTNPWWITVLFASITGGVPLFFGLAMFRKLQK